MNNLVKGTFLKRYKRFFADIKLPSGEIVVAHVPNTGSMKSCIENGWEAFLTPSNDPKRKLKYTLEFIGSPTGLIGINTHLTNKIVEEALHQNLIKEVVGYKNINREFTVGESRFDFQLTGHEHFSETYLEVKNVTLSLEASEVTFPDAVTTRGQKHLRELMELKKSGFRTIMLFVVQREDAHLFNPHQSIDPEYAKLLKEAHNAGVEILCYKTSFELPATHISHPLPIHWNQL